MPDTFAIDPIFQSALDALPAFIAVVDARRRIVAVNAAWARRVGDAGRSEGIGSIFLDSARPSATGPQGVDARAMYGGLRDVIAGDLPSFRHEYVRETTRGPVWLPTTMTRFEARAAPFVLVSTEDVTEQRGAPDELGAMAEERAGILEAVMLGQPLPRTLAQVARFLTHRRPGRRAYVRVDGVGVMLPALETLAAGVVDRNEPFVMGDTGEFLKPRPPSRPECVRGGSGPSGLPSRPGVRWSSS